MSLDAPAAAATPDGSARASRHRVGRRSRGNGPQPYDFRRPTKLSREHVRALQIVFETFARQWTTVLTTSLRAIAQVSLVSIEQQTYDEYVGTLSNPTLMHILSLEPIVGAGVLEFSVSSAMTSVDHMLGGPGAPDQPTRPLSDIESTLLKSLVTRVLGELRYAFEPVTRVQPEVTSLEYNPQFAQAASAADVVIVASFDLHVGRDECVATVCLPFNGVFPLLEIALGHGVTSERERAARAAAARAVADRLQEVPVDVAVRFRPTPLTPQALVGLAVGDVIGLDHPVSAPLAVTAADVTFAHAVAGAKGKRLACLVVDEPLGESQS
ncbi:MAG: flagellar motor switch protein FliM [Motilibacteraceae bacterium]